MSLCIADLGHASHPPSIFIVKINMTKDLNLVHISFPYNAKAHPRIRF